MKQLSEMFPLWPITHLHFSIFHSRQPAWRKKKCAFETFVYAHHYASMLGNQFTYFNRLFWKITNFIIFFSHFLCSLFGLRINNSNIPRKPKNRNDDTMLRQEDSGTQYVYDFVQKKISTRVNLFPISRERMKAGWKMNCVMNFILWLLQSTFHFQSDISET